MSDEKKIDTGGSACITGNVTVIGGDFVGRDKVIADLKAESDELQAEVLKGDKAGEDLVDGEKKIDTGGGACIIRSVTVSGGDFVRRDKVTMTDLSAEEGRPDTPLVTRPISKAELDGLQIELPKADEGFVARCLHNIRRVALTFWEWRKRP